MKSAVLHQALAVCLCAGLAAAKPQITEKTGVRAAAAVAKPATLARGSAFSITGAELGPADPVASDMPYGQELSGVSVLLTSADGALTVQAYIVSAAATKINAIVPSSTPAGDYKVTVSFNGETSDPFAVKVADRNFGVITRTGVAGGMASGRSRLESEEWLPIAYTRSVKPGRLVELDAAGIGPIEGPDNEYPAEQNLVDGAVIVLGGQEIPVTYLGRNPQKPGHDRLIAVIPEDVPTGCLTQFQVRVGDTLSSTVSLPVAQGEEGAVTCVHPRGLSIEALSALDAGDSIVTGDFSLSQQTMSVTIQGMSMNTKTETVTGMFSRYNAAQFELFMSSQETGWGLNPNGCTVLTAGEEDTAIPELDVTGVDAGKIRIHGPAGLDKVIPKAAGDAVAYSLTLSNSMSIPGMPDLPNIPGLPGIAGKNVIVKGAFNLIGEGGEVVGAFSSALNVPEPIVWTNKDASQFDQVNRSADLVFTWTGDGNDGDTVSAVGIARGRAPEDQSKTVSRIFVCYAPASARTLTVPSSILAQMPASVSEDELGSLSLEHSPAEKNVARIDAPLVGVEGGKIEPGSFRYGFGTTKTVTYH